MRLNPIHGHCHYVFHLQMPHRFLFLEIIFITLLSVSLKKRRRCSRRCCFVSLPAPDGDVLTLTIPQSDPFGPSHCKNEVKYLKKQIANASNMKREKVYIEINSTETHFKY